MIPYTYPSKTFFENAKSVTKKKALLLFLRERQEGSAGCFVGSNKLWCNFAAQFRFENAFIAMYSTKPLKNPFSSCISPSCC